LCGDKVLPRVIISTSIIIGIWQVSAIASSIRGAYYQLMMGGGYRYSNSAFLVFLAIISIVFLSSTSDDRWSANLLDKHIYWGPRQFNDGLFTPIKLLSIGWLILMFSVSIDFQDSLTNGEDFWCFLSRPEWRFQNHYKFIEISKNPRSILTCPRGWDNKMQDQKKQAIEEKRIWCSQL